MQVMSVELCIAHTQQGGEKIIISDRIEYNNMEQKVLYNLEQQDSEEEAYEALTKAISDIPVSSAQSIDVAWASENHIHETTRYVVTDKGSRYGENTLKIRGRGGKKTGGKYEIIPKPNSSPRIVYYTPDNTIGWDESLKILVISPSKYKFIEEDGKENPVFLEFVDDLRDRIGI